MDAMAHRALIASSILTLSIFAQAQSGGDTGDTGVTGSWREPGGSVIRIAPCNDDVCATLVKLGPGAATPFDARNPDPSKRTQKLCGLQIGYGFHLAGPQHAEGGHLYDPKSGRTYHGEMNSSDGTLKLRGYVGMKAFGRTETWTRVGTVKGSCT